MSARSAKPDFLLALAVLALVATGLMLILSASSILAFNRYADSLFFVKRQMLFAVVGIGAMAWLQGLDPKKLRLAMPWLMGLTILLLAAVLVPGLGRRVYGARRWLNLGPFGFQPSELFKLVLVLYTAERVAFALENGLPWQK